MTNAPHSVAEYGKFYYSNPSSPQKESASPAIQSVSFVVPVSAVSRHLAVATILETLGVG